MPLALLSERPPQPWRNGGGLTRELLAWAGGAGTDWLLRVSVADITQDGPFSPYPGVHRAFAVLEGAGVVLQWPEGERVLGPADEALHFAGEAAPGCRLVAGPTRDLNLMVRASAGQAAMRQAGPGQRGPEPASPWRALYTHGGAVLQADGQALALPPGTLWWDDTGPAGARWLLQAGVGAWWLELRGTESAHFPVHRSLHTSQAAQPLPTKLPAPTGIQPLSPRGRGVGERGENRGLGARPLSPSPSPARGEGSKTGLGASPAKEKEGPRQPAPSDR